MLKDLIKSQQKKGYSIPILDKATLAHGVVDSLKRRRDCFHPSEISGDFCPRAWILGQRDPSLYQSNLPDGRTQWIFDVGSELHELVQERLGSSGKLFGLWKCKRWCMSERCITYGFKPDGTACPMNTPEKVAWEYQEVPVLDADLEIAGKTDGVLVLDEGKFLFEFKTINSRSYSTLAEPMAHHVEQGEWYLDILSRYSHLMEAELLKREKLGEDVAELLRVQRQSFRGIIILYMNKDTQEFREFVISKNGPVVLPSTIRIRGVDFGTQEDALEEKKELLRQTLKWRDEGVLPDRLDICTSKSCSRAKYCFAKETCFKKD